MTLPFPWVRLATLCTIRITSSSLQLVEPTISRRYDRHLHPLPSQVSILCTETSTQIGPESMPILLCQQADSGSYCLGALCVDANSSSSSPVLSLNILQPFSPPRTFPGCNSTFKFLKRLNYLNFFNGRLSKTIKQFKFMLSWRIPIPMTTTQNTCVKNHGIRHAIANKKVVLLVISTKFNTADGFKSSKPSSVFSSRNLPDCSACLDCSSLAGNACCFLIGERFSGLLPLISLFCIQMTFLM